MKTISKHFARWMVALMVFATLIYSTVSLVNLRSDFEKIRADQVGGPIWTAMQLEYEYLRFLREINETLLHSPNEISDELKLRLDILWSRLNIIRGHDTDYVSEHPFVVDFEACLSEVDKVFFSNKQVTDRLLRISSLLTNEEDALRQYILDVKTSESKRNEQQREHIFTISSEVVGLAILMMMASFALVCVFYIDTKTHKQSAKVQSDLRKAAEASSCAKSDFISNVSHELRTPLTSIKGSLKLIQSLRMDNISDTHKKLLGIAEKNALRMSRLVDDILDFEKIESGNFALELGKVDLVDVVEDAISASEPLCAANNIELRNLTALDHAIMEGDFSRLSQICLNFISNAIKFSNTGGTVEVWVEKHGDQTIRFVVRDYGVGIPEAFRSHVFDRFSQAEEGATRRYGGTGIGLSIAQAIAEAHSGQVYFESSEGAGSTFYAEFPTFSDGGPVDHAFEGGVDDTDTAPRRRYS